MSYKYTLKSALLYVWIVTICNGYYSPYQLVNSEGNKRIPNDIQIDEEPPATIQLNFRPRIDFGTDTSWPYLGIPQTIGSSKIFICDPSVSAEITTLLKNSTYNAYAFGRIMSKDFTTTYIPEQTVIDFDACWEVKLGANSLLSSIATVSTLGTMHIIGVFGVTPLILRGRTLNPTQVLHFCPKNPGEGKYMMMQGRPFCPHNAKHASQVQMTTIKIFRPNMQTLAHAARRCYYKHWRVQTYKQFLGSVENNAPCPEQIDPLEEYEKCAKWKQGDICHVQGPDYYSRQIDTEDYIQFQYAPKGMITNNYISYKYEWMSGKDYRIYNCHVEMGRVTSNVMNGGYETAWGNIPDFAALKGYYNNSNGILVFPPFNFEELCAFDETTIYENVKLTIYDVKDYKGSVAPGATKVFAFVLPDSQQLIYVDDTMIVKNPSPCLALLPNSVNYNTRSFMLSVQLTGYAESGSIYDQPVNIVKLSDQSTRTILDPETGQLEISGNVLVDHSTIVNSSETINLQNTLKVTAPIVSGSALAPNILSGTKLDCGNNATVIIEGSCLFAAMNLKDPSQIVDVCCSPTKLTYAQEIFGSPKPTSNSNRVTNRTLVDVQDKIAYITQALQDMMNERTVAQNLIDCENAQRQYDIQQILLRTAPSDVWTSILGYPVFARETGSDVFKVSPCKYINQFRIIESLSVMHDEALDPKYAYKVYPKNSSVVEQLFVEDGIMSVLETGSAMAYLQKDLVNGNSTFGDTTQEPAYLRHIFKLMGIPIISTLCFSKPLIEFTDPGDPRVKILAQLDVDLSLLIDSFPYVQYCLDDYRLFKFNHQIHVFSGERYISKINEKDVQKLLNGGEVQQVAHDVNASDPILSNIIKSIFVVDSGLKWGVDTSIPFQTSHLFDDTSYFTAVTLFKSMDTSLKTLYQDLVSRVGYMEATNNGQIGILWQADSNVTGRDPRSSGDGGFGNVLGGIGKLLDGGGSFVKQTLEGLGNGGGALLKGAGEGGKSLTEGIGNGLSKIVDSAGSVLSTPIIVIVAVIGGILLIGILGCLIFNCKGDKKSEDKYAMDMQSMAQLYRMGDQKTIQGYYQPNLYDHLTSQTEETEKEEDEQWGDFEDWDDVHDDKTIIKPKSKDEDAKDNQTVVDESKSDNITNTDKTTNTKIPQIHPSEHKQHIVANKQKQVQSHPITKYPPIMQPQPMLPQPPPYQMPLMNPPFMFPTFLNPRPPKDNVKTVVTGLSSVLNNLITTGGSVANNAVTTGGSVSNNFIDHGGVEVIGEGIKRIPPVV